MGLSMEVLQLKIARGLKLTVEEMNFIEKATDEAGVVSRRKWTGWKEFPDSEIDFEPDPPPVQPLIFGGGEYSG